MAVVSDCFRQNQSRFIVVCWKGMASLGNTDRSALRLTAAHLPPVGRSAGAISERLEPCWARTAYIDMAMPKSTAANKWKHTKPHKTRKANNSKNGSKKNWQQQQVNMHAMISTAGAWSLVIVIVHSVCAGKLGCLPFTNSGLHLITCLSWRHRFLGRPLWFLW